jgi:hypothetical protein
VDLGSDISSMCFPILQRHGDDGSAAAFFGLRYKGHVEPLFLRRSCGCETARNYGDAEQCSQDLRYHATTITMMMTAVASAMMM